MLLADKWKDYKIIDCGEGEKLENIGGFLVSRPDSQVIWSKQLKIRNDVTYYNQR
ncbi:hypothetical protein OFR29_06245 [Brachyspira hyodysenteriae]|uniref:hypothetical protein n=1 Tax=Brachyspira hyodysenteriae TaxID=159 RepID=UPI0022CDBC0D|nr:hypothetical protein [Brachyspira hyodysenteriae]MCZ9891895.1 hypothetical protein [Brachyspira hyodysenteriae]MCZ9989447.1 hypothetical protein [Brachyspira hyodysenteriae]MCZ9997805.1 hypothetical protein [Brachyspira hyodysenteriae]MDA0001242.1 hypothetical protein [Brachyspira hyodysenteriae]MDA0006256.1 hypothetical protein [Brachyspira hyodysenteriae]